MSSLQTAYAPNIPPRRIPERPRVLLADDHTLILDGLTKLLDNQVELIGTVTNGLDLLAQAEALKPDVVLVDISMPGLNGLDAAKRMLQRLPQTKVIFVTMHNNDAYVQEALKAGASGYVLKSSAASELALAIKTVVNGGVYIAPNVQHAQPAEGGVAVRDEIGLTPRQREVLRLIASGATAKEVATALNISVRTAEFHKVSIMQKLGIRTTAQLTRFAIEHGLG